MALTITDANAKELIASGKPVIIDFWATWCGPCMAMVPIVDEMAKEYEGRVEIGKYNVDEESELSSEYRIMSIPTFLFFKDGKLVNKHVGAPNESKMRALFDKLL